MKFTLERRNNISKALRGRKLSDTHIQNLKSASKGHVVSEETRKKISTANSGRIRRPEELESMRLRQTSKKIHSDEHKEELRIKMRGNSFAIGQGGSKHWKWKGGITTENKKIRSSVEYVKWREQVMRRDNYTCQSCGDRGIELQVDYVFPFAFYADLRFELLNGRVLRVPCHKKTPTYMNRKDIYVEICK
jgi:hypothetical protein